MGHKSIVSGVFTNALFGAILYGINIFCQKTKDQQTRLYGIAGLSIACTFVLYAFVWKWTNVRTWSFYLVFIPLFLTSSFDFLTTYDLLVEPHGIFLTEYLGIKDPHVHNVVATNFVLFDGIILHFINFAALCRLGSGKSSRSLQLISATGLCMVSCLYLFCTLTSELPLHLLTNIFLTVLVIYVLLIPVGVLRMPRNFILSHKQGSGIVGKLLALTTLPLLVAAGAVFVAKAMVLNGARNEYLDFVRLNDPLIFLNDVEKTFPFIAGVIWQNVIVSLPILIISFIYHLKSSKPTMLWELSIINLGLTLMNQFFFIAGSLYWKTPKNLQVNPANTTFWIINLIPIFATLAQVVSLLPFRASLVSVKAKTKKRS